MLDRRFENDGGEGSTGVGNVILERMLENTVEIVYMKPESDDESIAVLGLKPRAPPKKKF